ncbi:MAG: transposase [bacterium]
MLHIKGIKNLGEIKGLFAIEAKGAETILDVFERFFISSVTRHCDSVKNKGYYASDVLQVLLYLPFLGVATIRGLFKSGCAHITDAEKDVYYRLKNNSAINWRTMHFSFARRFRKITEQQGEANPEASKCFIVDDSDNEKTGMKIEFIGKVYDHVHHRWILGFKSLLLAYWDGKSILPLDFSLHHEKGKNKKRPYGLTRTQLRKRFSKKREQKTPAAKRVAELSANKINNAIKMIKRAVKHGFTADYVLADSWYISESFVSSIRKIKTGALHVLGMSRLDKRKYLFEGTEYTAKELLNKFKRHKKRSRKVNAFYIELMVEYKGMPVKLFLSRYSRRSKWHLLLTTDLRLTFNKAIEIYTHRWTIEVFFKEAKQHLNLGKAQANDFDSQIADMSISMMQYTVLTLYKRFHAYESFGELFRASKQFLLELTLAKRLWGLFLELQQKIAELFEIDIEQLMAKIVKEQEFEYKILKIFQALDQNTEPAIT